MPNPNLKKLRESTKELVDFIKEISRSQKSSWQQVPYLALQADGRTGYSDRYARAYCHGYWALEATVRNGCYSVYVDLETGELVNAFDRTNKVRDEDILMIASNTTQIDATSLVVKLAKDSEQPTYSGYNAREQEKWRQEIVIEYNLKPLEYRRKFYIVR